jgi:CheY-like chemotaxis protein
MTNPVDSKLDEEMKAALVQLFLLANMDPPVASITAKDVLMAIRELKGQLETGGGGSMQVFSQGTQNAPPSFGSFGGFEDDGGGGSDGDPFSSMASLIQGAPPPEAIKIDGAQILIVGELGIITYQLKLALTRKGANVTIVKGVDEAIVEYSKRAYTGMLIDIYMPTEREGLLVLMEINRLAEEKRQRTSIVVLATPIKEKRLDLKEICKQRGASFFLEKTEGWHQRVIDFFTGQLDPNEV